MTYQSDSVLCELERDGDSLKCRVCGRAILWAGTKPPVAVCRTPPQPAPEPVLGVGGHFKKLLAGWPFRITATPNCACNAHARQMDEWGPEECEQRMAEILGWLEIQAKARKLIFVRFAAEQLVRLAIRRARKSALRLDRQGHKPIEGVARSDGSPA